MGTHVGLDGKHGSLMQVTLQRIKYLARQTESLRLRWVCLENVPGITFKKKSGTVFKNMQEWWRANMKDWTDLKIIRMDARDSGLAQRRDRVFIVSFQEDFAAVTGDMTDKPIALPHQSLQDVLQDVAPDFDHLRVDGGPQLTALHIQNITAVMKKFKKMDRSARVGLRIRKYGSHFPDSDLAVVDPTRWPYSADHKAFCNTIHVGYCPCLTATNRRLVVISRREDGRNPKVPLVGYRQISNAERAALSGVVWDSVSDSMSPWKLTVSFGNMIPVNMAGSILQLIMDKWAVWEDCLMSMGFNLPGPGVTETPEEDDIIMPLVLPLEDKPESMTKRRRTMGELEFEQVQETAEASVSTQFSSGSSGSQQAGSH